MTFEAFPHRKVARFGAWCLGLAAVLLAAPALMEPTRMSMTVHAQSANCLPPISNPIVCENALAGNPASEWDVAGAGDATIQGFATDISVNHGQTISFKVKTQASQYRVDIYRLGYYGGMGARKVATVQPSVNLPQNQPACLSNSTTGLIDCGNWAVSASWSVPVNAVSGVYIARLVRTDTSGASHMVFIVRDDEHHSDLLFQTSDTTWQAYNDYGGNSLYVGSPAGRAYKVSYNRPFVTRGNQYARAWLFDGDYPMIRWLEANGYFVSYTTGVDTDRRGSELLEHQAFLSVGHDEYWSAGQRANVEAARAAGVNLAFFSGNEMFWKTRWENSISSPATAYRTLVSYKETHANAKIDPTPTWTGTWRDPRFSPPADGGQPENAVTGTIFMGNCCPNPDLPITVSDTQGMARFWRNTAAASLDPGDTLDVAPGIVGYEFDADLDNGFRPQGLIRLSTTTTSYGQTLQDYGSTYGPGTITHALTLYRHPSGALVFGAGLTRWAWALDTTHDLDSATPNAVPTTSPVVQQATVNLLADMGSQPLTLQPGLVPATPSADAIGPATSITSPSNGASTTLGTTLAITGTATDADGIVTGIEVSVDGGNTWKAAAGLATWTFTWTPPSLGSFTIQARAIDDSANIGAVSSAGIAVIAGPPSLGPTTVGANVDSGDSNYLNGSSITTTTAAVVTSMSVYVTDVDTSASNRQYQFAIYSDGGGRPGSLLATSTSGTLVPNSWNTAAVSAALQAGTPYWLIYNTNGRTSDVNNMTFDDAALGQGVYSTAPVAYGTWPTTFPASTLTTARYSLYATLVPPDATPPTVIGVTPSAGATGVLRTGATISETFSESMDPATVSATTFELRDPSGLVVPAIVAYSSATHAASLEPSSPLAPAATYTLRVRGGATGVKDLAGNPLAADVTTAFTTAGAPALGVTATGRFGESGDFASTSPVTTQPSTNLVVYVAGEGGTTTYPTITDTYNNTWAPQGVQLTSSWPGFLWVFSSFHAQGGPAHTITATKANSYATILAVEVLGTNVAVADGSIATDDVSPYATPTLSAAGNALLLGAFAPGWPGEDVTIVPGGGFATVVEERHGGDAWTASVAGRTVPAGTYSANWTMSGGTIDGGAAVDELVLTGVPLADTTWPTLTTLSPPAGSVASIHSPVVAAFSERLDPATVSGSTVELRDALNALVPATITYDDTTRTARLQPTSALTPAGTYTARVRSGTTGVKDLAGNPLSADVTASFTAVDAPMVGAVARGRYVDDDPDSARTSSVTTQAATNLVVYVHGEGGNGDFPTITDAYNNPWTPVAVRQTSAWPGFLWVFTSLNAAGGPNHWFTTTKHDGYATILAVEVVGTNVTLAESAVGIDNVSPFATPALSSASSALVLGAFAPGFPGETVTITPTNGFGTIVEEPHGDGAWVASVAARTVPAGTYSAAWQMTGGFDDFDFGSSLLVFRYGTTDAPTVGASTRGRYSDEVPDFALTSPVTTQATTNLVVYVHGEGGNASFPTITDTYNNAWTPVGVQQSSHWPGFLWVFTSLGAHGGPNHQFTTTKPEGFQTILAVEVLGSNVTLAASAMGTDDVSPFTTPVVSSARGALLLGAFAPGFPGTPVTITPTNGFSTVVEETNGDGAWVASVAAHIVSPGFYEAGWLLTGGVDDFDFALSMLAFRNGP
jgi:hypothetical protein